MTHFLHVTSYRAARKACPGAAIICRCDGGYVAFDSMVDYATWRGQK